MAARKKKSSGVIGTLLLAVLVALLATFAPHLFQKEAPAPAPAPVEGQISLHVIDVGQADAILIQTPDGNMLIDAGENGASRESDLLDYLASVGVSELEYFVATHNHSDHIGGADAVLRALSVKRVLMTDAVATTGVYEAMLDAIEQKGIEVVIAAPDMRFAIGSLACRVLAPLDEYSNTNDQSIVLRLTYGGVSMMLTGDAEGNLEGESEKDMLAHYRPSELQADFYKAGHHGSDTSSNPAFLDAVRPSLVAISCGRDNKYGHPNASTLEALERIGATVYRTDELGDLVFVCDGDAIWLQK